jgi:hypothetical protein
MWRTSTPFSSANLAGLTEEFSGGAALEVSN